MTPDRWARISEVFAAALEKAPGERSRFLDEACGSDQDLRQEVESLLAEAQDSWLKSPVESAPPPELGAGQVLGRYRIESKLGQGGMGAVYKAHDSVLRRTVALKVLPAWRFADPESKQRLMREARAASALSHPHIVTTYDIDQADSIDFIAMEYVPGKTLDQVIPRKGLRLAEALKYAVQVADALAAAHTAGIVHRDIKPSNIAVSDQGQVKVLDFGLAKRVGAAPGEASTATAQGVIMGTAAYMSPEQAEGKPADARSDIFSFGAVLYEMVTGRRAFPGDTPMSTMAAILNQEPAPIEGAPAELFKIVAKCLRKEPSRRWQHLGDVRLLLEEMLEAPPEVKRVEPPRRRRWLVPVLLALALIAGAGLGLWYRWPTSTETLEAPLPLTSSPGRVFEPQVSPDGKHVAFIWIGERNDNYDVYVQLIGAGTPLRLTADPAPEFSPAWSPDGRNLAFLRTVPGGREEILVIPAFGGVERKVGEMAAVIHAVGFEGPHITWTPDGNSLVFQDAGRQNQPAGLSLLSLQTGENRPLTSPSVGMGIDTGPTFSPDGRSLAFRRMYSHLASDIFLMPLGPDYRARGGLKRLTHGAFAATPAWTPDGREIVYSDGPIGSQTLWRVPAREGAKPSRLPLSGEGLLFPSISRPAAGMAPRLVYAQWSWRLNVWEAAIVGNQPPVPLLTSMRRDYEAEYSPNGERIAFASDRSGRFEVWTCLRDGTQALQLTTIGRVSGPRWSPDGASIVFHSTAEGQNEIYVVSANGGASRRLTDHPAVDSHPMMTRDGKWIFFGSNRTGRYEVWKMPATGGEPLQFTRNGGRVPKESPDGKYIYYNRPPFGLGTLSLWRQAAGGGAEEEIVDRLFMGSGFSVGANSVYYRPVPPNTVIIYRRDLRTGKTDIIARVPRLRANNLAVSPDERHILFDRAEVDASDLKYVERFR